MAHALSQTQDGQKPSTPHKPATHKLTPLDQVIDVNSINSLAELFRERVRRSAAKTAYRYFDHSEKKWRQWSWLECSEIVSSYQKALCHDGLKPGDRVAIMLNNSPEWVLFEQAALGLGLIVVPLYTNDRIENVSYVLQDAGVKVLAVEGREHLEALKEISSQVDGLVRLLSRDTFKRYNVFSKLMTIREWSQQVEIQSISIANWQAKADDLATIVYTSGTTGRPKGVMLSHRNIFSNAAAGGVLGIAVKPDDVFLSFLPLSHMLERTAGYYIPMISGATVAFARSIQDLAEDLITIKPSVLISVPRIYERVYNKIYAQLEHKSPIARGLFLKAVECGWQRFKTGHTPLSWPLLRSLVANKVMAKLGGRVRIAICGGAPLSTEVAKTFIGLGLNLLQGYGLTETSPVIAVNRPDDNDPASVGAPLDGVEVKIGDDDELLARGECVMLGYWNNTQASKEIIDKDGWLHTGDKAKIENGKIYITGRIKEILVLSNGEKMPPADMEMAITMDSLFEQALVIGEGKPYLCALLVLSTENCETLSKHLHVEISDLDKINEKPYEKALLKHVAHCVHEFPGYAQIKRVHVCREGWTVENGLMTPTLKLKRNKIVEKYNDAIDALYHGH